MKMMQVNIQIGDEIVIKVKAKDPNVNRKVPISEIIFGPNLIRSRLPNVAPRGHPIDIGSKTNPENIAPLSSTV